MKRSWEQYREAVSNLFENRSISYTEKWEIEKKMEAEWLDELDVGDHAHVSLWSDVEPVTVVKRTKKTVTVRRDKAERDPNWKPEWIPGGFSAICTNNEDQQWIIEEDPSGRTETFYWSGVNNRWQHNDCTLRPGWLKIYDYNF